ncbi:uncharacterized protein LOC119092613 [Pollicipes pollicipes]|uniref:uncharacterized protein LOC119092613 n=1 Tax=Pollicipes pollicipes TaxID=41117 RepID=UPI00188536AD|nr:uncharacterized protein LOC119092613 [Pollicipes pollicipes]
MGVYQAHLTPFAFQAVEAQAKVIDNVELDRVGDEFRCTTTSGCPITPSSTHCQCSFRRRYQLPCRHMLRVRQVLGLGLFEDTLFSSRWNMGSQHVPVTRRDPTLTLQSAPRETRALTQHERYRRALAIANQIASVGSELTGDGFDAFTQALKDTLANLKQGQMYAPVILHNAGSGDAHSCTNDIDAGVDADLGSQPSDSAPDQDVARDVFSPGPFSQSAAGDIRPVSSADSSRQGVATEVRTVSSGPSSQSAAGDTSPVSSAGSSRQGAATEARSVFSSGSSSQGEAEEGRRAPFAGSSEQVSFGAGSVHVTDRGMRSDWGISPNWNI